MNTRSPSLCLRRPPTEKRRSADLSARITTEQMQFLGALADQCGTTRADALALMIDVVVAGRMLPVIPRGTIPPPATLQALQQRSTLIDRELHVLTPRINIPLPPSDDPDYAMFVGWRARWTVLFPQLIECVSALETLRAQLLPQLPIDPVKLARVADLWAARLEALYTRTRAQLTETSDVDLHEQLAGVAESWQLLFAMGLATPSAELDAKATRGFPLALNRHPLVQSAVAHDAGNGVDATHLGHVTFRVRITKRHEQDLKKVRRSLRCRDKSATVRLVIDRYRQLGSPWDFATRTASLADLTGGKTLANRLGQRLREVISRLRAPLSDETDAAFVAQVNRWKESCEHLLARTTAVECQIRCVMRAMNGLKNTSIERCLPFLSRVWFVKLPQVLAAAERRLAELKKQSTGDGNELTELSTMLDSRCLWHLLYALGMAPPIEGQAARLSSAPPVDTN